jgi:hypothetical protein
MRQLNDPEMPARHGGDRTMNNLSAAAEPWVKPMEKRKSNEPHDPEGISVNLSINPLIVIYMTPIPFWYHLSF